MAAGLVAALAALRRSGGSMFLGRKAVSIWLLAALLHGPAIAGDGRARRSPALPEAVTALMQIAAASIALGLGLVLLAALFAGRLALAFDRWRSGRRRVRAVRIARRRSLRAPPAARALLARLHLGSGRRARWRGRPLSMFLHV